MRSSSSMLAAIDEPSTVSVTAGWSITAPQSAWVLRWELMTVASAGWMRVPQLTIRPLCSSSRTQRKCLRPRPPRFSPSTSPSATDHRLDRGRVFRRFCRWCCAFFLRRFLLLASNIALTSGSHWPVVPAFGQPQGTKVSLRCWLRRCRKPCRVAGKRLPWIPPPFSHYRRPDRSRWRRLLRPRALVLSQHSNSDIERRRRQRQCHANHIP